VSRLAYLERILSAYMIKKESHLTFWHGEPLVNQNFEPGKLGEYYMPFTAKANYSGYYDDKDIPLLNYHGRVGLQYNPIAIAQYGLGNYNLFVRTGEENRKAKFLKVADWFVKNLETTPQGTRVWYHHFDWEYRDNLKAPWHSALAQGQGISLLVRAHRETRNNVYLTAAQDAFHTFEKDVKEGGVTVSDSKGYLWFEEAIVDPPTHILNGFIWASWGIYDYSIYTGNHHADQLFNEAVRTLVDNLPEFDAGFWSLYEQSGTRMKMLASPFYHSLHIVQLEVMYKLTKEPIFKQFADRWNAYRQNALKRKAALIYKAIFKILYY
jgi:heparosan-N-sulfate-glucuronate 5-epimerase